MSKFELQHSHACDQTGAKIPVVIIIIGSGVRWHCSGTDTFPAFCSDPIDDIMPLIDIPTQPDSDDSSSAFDCLVYIYLLEIEGKYTFHHQSRKDQTRCPDCDWEAGN